MPSSNRKVRRTLAATLICLVALLGAAQCAIAAGPPEKAAASRPPARMSYGQLLTAIDRGQVKSAAIAETSGNVAITLRSGAKFNVTAPPDDALPTL